MGALARASASEIPAGPPPTIARSVSIVLPVCTERASMNARNKHPFTSDCPRARRGREGD